MGNWDKRFFLTELVNRGNAAPWTPRFAGHEAQLLMSMNSEIIKGAFYMDVAWFWPGKWPQTKSDEGTLKAHKHDYDEAVAYVGTGPHDPYDLGGEIEFWVDGQQNILDRSFVAFIPAGIKHGPLTIRRVDAPIFHFTAGMGKKYF
jgi:hypothetical protein